MRKKIERHIGKHPLDAKAKRAKHSKEFGRKKARQAEELLKAAERKAIQKADRERVRALRETSQKIQKISAKDLLQIIAEKPMRCFPPPPACTMPETEPTPETHPEVLVELYQDLEHVIVPSTKYLEFKKLLGLSDKERVPGSDSVDMNRYAHSMGLYRFFSVHCFLVAMIHENKLDSLPEYKDVRATLGKEVANDIRETLHQLCEAQPHFAKLVAESPAENSEPEVNTVSPSASS